MFEEVEGQDYSRPGNEGLWKAIQIGGQCAKTPFIVIGELSEQIDQGIYKLRLNQSEFNDQ